MPNWYVTIFMLDGTVVCIGGYGPSYREAFEVAHKRTPRNGRAMIHCPRHADGPLYEKARGLLMRVPEHG